MTAARGQRILVVEDNEVNQMVAASMLEKQGFHTDRAANGLEALEALARQDYPAVLMDCQMPEMDGYQATLEIRRREGINRRTPIIAMTASALSGDREKCLAAGMDDYLSKPLRAEALHTILAQWTPAEATVGRDRPSSHADGPDDLLDYAQIGQLKAAIGPTGLTAVIDAFASDSANQTSEISAALRAGDASALVVAAHTLKGAAANLGAAHVAQLSAQLEDLARAGELVHALTLADELVRAVGQAPETLREALTR